MRCPILPSRGDQKTGWLLLPLAARSLPSGPQACVDDHLPQVCSWSVALWGQLIKDHTLFRKHMSLALKHSRQFATRLTSLSRLSSCSQSICIVCARTGLSRGISGVLPSQDPCLAPEVQLGPPLGSPMQCSQDPAFCHLVPVALSPSVSSAPRRTCGSECSGESPMARVSPHS